MVSFVLLTSIIISLPDAELRTFTTFISDKPNNSGVKLREFLDVGSMGRSLFPSYFQPAGSLLKITAPRKDAKSQLIYTLINFDKQVFLGIAELHFPLYM
jgi:hypothetical protein